ncbi:hypothetical protein C8F01DRAFT_1123527 [Mycena amicta]|nr:hypothetical protein C8F01DRAFT_1123527 [Mycena amicta]
MHSDDNLDLDLYDVVLETPAQRQVREEYTRQNSRAAIARLPPEILADIFCRCVPTSIREVQTDFKSPTSWLAITRVSSHWRSVAVGCPDFWTTLVLSPPKLTALMLIRSRSAALIIRADLQQDADNSPEPIVLEHTARLGTLDIRSPSYQLDIFLSNLKNANDAPRLQSVKFVNTEVASRPDGFWLPRNLFNRDQVVQDRKSGTWPTLDLHLDGCAFSWDSLWYTQLAHLHLENISPLQRPTTEKFLTILAASPCLQTLTIIHCAPITRRGFQVSLPYLTSFTLKSDSPSTCGRLVGFLKLSPSATVSVNCNIKNNHDCRSAIQGFCASASASSRHYDTVRIHQRDGFLLELTHSCTSYSRKLQIDAIGWSTSTNAVLNIASTTDNVLDMLDFSFVTTLHLQGFDVIPQDRDDRLLFVYDAMGRCIPRLHTLHLHGGFPVGWLEFLLTQAMLLVGVSHYSSCFNRGFGFGTGLAFRGPDGVLKHAWPTLRRLCLHGVDFVVSGNSKSKSIKRMSVDSLTEKMEAAAIPNRASILRALMWARREGRVPLWRLELADDCKNVTETDLSWFNIFVDVDRDGKQVKSASRMDLDWDSSNAIDIFANMVTIYRGQRL